MGDLDGSFLLPSPIEELKDDWFKQKNIKVLVKRDDMIHPWLSGNKYRKLKYNLEQAKEANKSTIITFGGAFSNHLYAVAGACDIYGFKSIGIIRGEIDSDNPTIQFCLDKNMKLIPVSRHEYKKKEQSIVVQDILKEYSNYYLVPEGGSNPLSLLGTAELVDEMYTQLGCIPDYLVLPTATGGTAAGLLSAEGLQSKVLAFSVLKSGEVRNSILSLANNRNEELLTVVSEYHFGGYAKKNQILLDFIIAFEKKYNIPIDHVYNAKSLYGLFDMIAIGDIPDNSCVCYIHTGGLQGKMGLEYMHSTKNHEVRNQKGTQLKK